MANRENSPIQKKEREAVEGVERTREGKLFAPPVDIIETNDDLMLIADMPGVSEKSINVTLEQDTLTIEGRVEPEPPKGYDLSYCEYEIGDFQRSFTLSDTVDREKIEASYKDGVLKLRLPKAEPAKPKKINVRVE